MLINGVLCTNLNPSLMSLLFEELMGMLQAVQSLDGANRCFDCIQVMMPWVSLKIIFPNSRRDISETLNKLSNR